MPKRLIYQFHHNADKFEYVQYSSMSAQQYCKRYGIDYILDDPKDDYIPWAFNSYLFDRYRSISYLKNYDQVLFLDSDVLILPHSENIFDEYYESGLVGMYFTVADQANHRDSKFIATPINQGVMLFNNEYNDPNLKEPRYPGKLYDHQVIRNDYNNLSSENEEYLYKHSGTWWKSWERKYKEYITYDKNGQPSDDNFFNIILALYRPITFHIDRKWNYMHVFNEERDNAQFLHFAHDYKPYLKKYYLEYYK